MSQLPKSLRGRTDLYVFDPLSASDRKLAAAIMADHRIVELMHRAWRMTLASGLEHSFYIYRGRTGLYPGALWTGLTDRDGGKHTARYQYLEARTNPDILIADYHTHPDLNPKDRFTDQGDLAAYRNECALGFIQTHYGLFVGKSGHNVR